MGNECTFFDSILPCVHNSSSERDLISRNYHRTGRFLASRWTGRVVRSCSLKRGSRLTQVTTFQLMPGLLGSTRHPKHTIGESRGGRADVYDAVGRPLRALDLGDASQDVQTTPSGKIWVSYFDEGVYGGGLGSQHGIVCFNSSGNLLFKYFDFAEENELPFIDDCYAMNVVSEDEVWLSYYSAFPLVSIRRFQLQRAWRDFGCMDRAFALFEGAVIFPKCPTQINEGNSELLRRTLSESPRTEALEVIDDEGRTIAGQFKAAARGSQIYLWTETALYELAP